MSGGTGPDRFESGTSGPGYGTHPAADSGRDRPAADASGQSVEKSDEKQSDKICNRGHRDDRRRGRLFLDGGRGQTGLGGSSRPGGAGGGFQLPHVNPNGRRCCGRDAENGRPFSDLAGIRHERGNVCRWQNRTANVFLGGGKRHYDASAGSQKNHADAVQRGSTGQDAAAEQRPALYVQPDDELRICRTGPYGNQRCGV
ncbi:MAG: hypothetical protein BWY71_01106 [Planctomycetes bacterium ADurb.Bin412]|nr:MAG: hypothetical protein BWY71_01106 [Planctomycetes bacterium ADurb.Bin412]